MLDIEAARPKDNVSFSIWIHPAKVRVWLEPNPCNEAGPKMLLWSLFGVLIEPRSPEPALVAPNLLVRVEGHSLRGSF